MVRPANAVGLHCQFSHLTFDCDK